MCVSYSFRCPSYPAIPQYCTLETDPKDFCCQRPVCNYDKPVIIPTPGPNKPVTLAPIPGQPTLVPTPGQPGTQTTQAPVLGKIKFIHLLFA